jgi:hypothetical protein
MLVDASAWGLLRLYIRKYNRFLPTTKSLLEGIKKKMKNKKERTKVILGK